MSTMTGRNRIMIYGPKRDGTYVVEFRTADGDALAISVTAGETSVLKHFQDRMPYGTVRAGCSVMCVMAARNAPRNL
jgi:hypothetical protein